MSQTHPVADRWARRLKDFLSGFIRDTEPLRRCAADASIILHGSTIQGIDNACSDLDLWLVAPADAVERAEKLAGTRFFGFVLEGKASHVNLETRQEFAARLQHCDLERIAELQTCQVLSDSRHWSDSILANARRPMSEAVRRAWFCYHYVEMRGEHRACDNPIDRGDAIALLLAMTPSLAHTMRAAMVLDGMPYPYIKWLGQAAAKTPTGAKVTHLVDQIIDRIGEGALRQPGPEREHAVGKRIREIRAILIESAKANGIDEPWLDRWWLHMTQARQGIAGVSW